MVSRRRILTVGASGLAASFVGGRSWGGSLPAYSSRTVDLVQQATVIDMLGLLTLDYRKLCAWQEQPAAFPQAEFARLKASGVTVIHPAVGFVKGDAYDSSLADFTRWNHFLAAHADQFVRIESPGEIAQAKAGGKIGVILGLQNSRHFRTLEDVSFFYGMGQRVSQLTYYNNRLGGGSTDQAQRLSTYGADVIARMNALGMAVDLSHCSDRTTLDAMEASTKPVLVTHSNCRALVPGSTRCKSDDAIRRLAAKGGVFGITMVRPFVRATGKVTVEHVLDHIDHIVRLVGVAHVGLGTDVDLDGRDASSDLDSAQYACKIFDVTEGLLRRRYSEQDIQLILGGNFERTLAAIWTS